jgi:hypothetical protein
MRRRLKIPAAIVVTVVALAGCDDDEPYCPLLCLQVNDAGVTTDAVAHQCPECADENLTCPSGCEAVG